MLRLTIRHHTTYRYTAPVTFGRHRLVLRPREGHDLRITAMRLAIRPAHLLSWTRDVYGNSVALVDFLEDADALAIVNEVAIERSDPFPEKRPHEPWRVAWPVQYEPVEIPVVQSYQASSYLDEADAVRAWVDEVLPQRIPNDAEGNVTALGRAVHDAIAYRRREEKGVQSPAQTIALGSGSCRDMATLLMEAARGLGVASRFASGYLHGTASLAGRASTHAWTEVYLPALGWRGVDPTIGAAIGLHHVVTGVSQHPRGVMPVSGTFQRGLGAFQGMQVQVETRVLADGEDGTLPAPDAPESARESGARLVRRAPPAPTVGPTPSGASST